MYLCIRLLCVYLVIFQRFGVLMGDWGGGGVIPNIRYGVANSGHRPIRCSILEFKDQQGVESTKVFLNFIQ